MTIVTLSCLLLLLNANIFSGACVILGEYSSWSLWDDCSASCGGGNQSRWRSLCCPAVNGAWDDCRARYNKTEKYLFEDRNCSESCFNGGTYISGLGCACPQRYRDICCSTHIDECANHPCKNGGFCVNQINGYTCSCPAGYVGHNCTIEIDECASSPCKNGGSCEDMVNGYICTCPSGFTSHDCSTVNTIPATNVHDCFFKSSLYVGQVSQTIDNVTCDRWDVHLLPGNLLASKLPDPKLSDAANFCRDPDGKGHPWCYISGNGLKTWEFCDVLFCEECYYANHSQVYNGYVKSTPHGECLNWTGASFIEGYFPDGSVTRAENYCRDPDGTGHPYCLTSHGFASCSISQCKNAVCADDPQTLCFHLKSVVCGIKHTAQQLCPKTCAMCGFGLLPPVHVQPPMHRAPCQDDPMARCDVLREFICADPKTAQYCPKSCYLCSDAVKGEIVGK